MSRSRRAVALGSAVAILVPILVTALVPHDVDRVLFPAGLMLIAVGAGTLIGGWIPGLVGAVLSIGLVDYYFLRPQHSFAAREGEELAALIMFAVIVIGFALTLELLVARARRAAEAQVRAEEAATFTRRAVVTLQETLLPHQPPDFDGVDIECRYVAADGDRVVGGDWFAVVPITPTRLGVAIGDVAGHGLLASQVMAETRFALRGLALSDIDPADCLGVLNQVLFRFGDRPHVTATYGVLDLDAGTWTQAVAGHPPALCLHRDGTVRRLEQIPGPALGVSPEPTFVAQSFPLPAGSTLLLYTDGLCERRGETLDVGIDRLGTTFARTTGDARTLAVACDDLIARMADTTHSDDVALVAVHCRDRGRRSGRAREGLPPVRAPRLAPVDATSEPGNQLRSA